MLVDTGPIVAVLVESDEHHAASVEQLRHIRSPLLTCWPVITEAMWLLRNYPRAITALLSSLSGQPFTLLPLGETDLRGITAVLSRYNDLGLQLADAALVHLANRNGIETIFTLDRRGFGAIRLARGRKPRIIP